MAEPEPIERIAVRIAWIGVEDVPIAFVNQVIGQIDDKGEAIITFGQATPPLLIGHSDPGERLTVSEKKP